MISLYESVKQDVIAAKQHFKKGNRTHIEIIFSNKNTLSHHAAKGINIFNKSYFGYIPTDSHKSFLPVKLRNVPLGGKEEITTLIKDAFQDFGKIASIKPLVIERTLYLTDQWIVIFDTT